MFNKVVILIYFEYFLGYLQSWLTKAKDIKKANNIENIFIKNIFTNNILAKAFLKAFLNKII